MTLIIDKMLKSENINTIVIHCSDTPDNKNISAKEIHEMHLKFGWNGIGYHKVICRNGVIQNGRPEYWIGAHAKGVNQSSLGVCLIGRSQFSNEQFNSLKKIIIGWKSVYNISKILGHYEAVNTRKTCPNFDVKKWCIENFI
jgi:N-acetylmuramoyl-L-alanine amidase